MKNIRRLTGLLIMIIEERKHKKECEDNIIIMTTVIKPYLMIGHWKNAYPFFRFS